MIEKEYKLSKSYDPALAITTMVSLPARHLRMYQMIGSARFVLSVKTNLNLLKTEH